jgi:hypothetical protein
MLKVVWRVLADSELYPDVKMAAFSDIHAEALYDPDASNLNYCKPADPKTSP